MVQIALALCSHEGRWLVGRRAENVHLPGLWEFPGGKLLTGESPEEAAVREAEEELGVQVRAVRALKTVCFEYPDRKVELHPILCAWVSGEPAAMEAAVIEARWATYEELQRLHMPKANEAIIDQLADL